MIVRPRRGRRRREGTGKVLAPAAFAFAARQPLELAGIGNSFRVARSRRSRGRETDARRFITGRKRARVALRSLTVGGRWEISLLEDVAGRRGHGLAMPLGARLIARRGWSCQRSY